MAELTQFQSEGASTAQFQSAPIVTPDTQASEINLFSSLAGGVMDGYAKHQESKANQANQAKINTFTDKLGRLAQVGEKDGTPQMNNMRVAYLKTIAQDPSNEEEYTKMFKRQTGQEPLAPSAADVQYAKAEEEARASNMIHIGANAEQVAAGIEAYQAQVAQEEAWTHDNKLIENKLKNEQLSTVERENVQREKKEKANEQVKSLATTGLVSLGNELQELTTSDMTVEQQVMALDQMELDFEDRLSKKLMDSADSTLVDIVRSSYESRIGIARSVIDGSRTVAEATRQVEHLEAVQKLMLVADPTGRLFSLMGLVPETTHSLILQHANFANIGSMAMDISNPDTKVTPNVYDKPDETAVAYVFAREYMKPGSSPEQEKVGEEIYNTYIDAAIVNEAQIESPKEVVPTVEALATPEGQKWAQNNPDRAADVGNHLLRHYNDNIQEEMTQRLQDQITVTLPRTGLAPNFYATTGAEYLVLVDSDAGYNFMINPDADLPHDGLRPQLNELAQKLNKPLGKYTKAMMNVGAKESLDASMQTLRAFALPETNLALPQEEPEVERVAELNAGEIEAVAILGGESAGRGYLGSNRESRLAEIRKNVGLAEDGSEDKDARTVLEQNMLDNPDRTTKEERAKQRKIGLLERQLSGEDSMPRSAFRNVAEYKAGVQAELDELRGVQGEEAEVTPVGKPDEVVEVTLGNEGGLSVDPDDSGNIVKGGEVIGTNHGITPATLANARGVDTSTITAQDMENLSQEEARAIYNEEFLTKPKIDQLSENVQQATFDFGVTAGPAQAIKILQRVAGVKDDGIIGPQTIAAVSTVDRGELIDAYIEFYENLAKSQPKNEKFLKGWVARANRNR